MRQDRGDPATIQHQRARQADAHMSRQPPAPDDHVADDQRKAHTPDTLRNDKARWKEHDMPEDRETAHAEDYERPPTDR